MRKKYSLERKENIAGYLFVSPWVLGFLMFMLFPIIGTLLLTFTRWDGVDLSKLNFVGFDTWIYNLSDPDGFLKALGNTVYYTFIGVPLQIIVSLITAKS